MTFIKYSSILVGFLVSCIILTGCGTKAQLESEKQEKEREDAKFELLTKYWRHTPIDRKVPLLAIKYSVPETVIHEFVAIYEIEQCAIMKVFAVTNIAEIQDMEARLANLPPVSNTVNQIAIKHGVKPETVASVLMDYYSWLEREKNYE